MTHVEHKMSSEDEFDVFNDVEADAYMGLDLEDDTETENCSESMHTQKQQRGNLRGRYFFGALENPKKMPILPKKNETMWGLEISSREP